MKLSDMIAELQHAKDTLGDVEVLKESDVEESWWCKLVEFTLVAWKQETKTAAGDPVGSFVNDGSHTHAVLIWK